MTEDSTITPNESETKRTWADTAIFGLLLGAMTYAAHRESRERKERRERAARDAGSWF